MNEFLDLKYFRLIRYKFNTLAHQFMNMKGQWIHQSEINRSEWEQLHLKGSYQSVYVQANYLDAVAIDWEAYIAKDFSYAIPVGIVNKGGINRVYPPNFLGYMVPIGDASKVDWQDFEDSLLERFKKGDLLLKHGKISKISSRNLVYQIVDKSKFKLKSQAKRKITQFKKSRYKIEPIEGDCQQLAELIAEELSKKLPLFKTRSIAHYYAIIKAMHQQGQTIQFGVFDDNQLVGGVIGFNFENELYYFKGACKSEALSVGAMYAAMEAFISYGFNLEKQINFGGSNVAGVRFFYQRFNGVDVQYQHFCWDNSPIYFKFLYWLNSKLKRR